MSRYMHDPQRVTYATRLGPYGQPLPQQRAAQYRQQNGNSSSFPTSLHGGRHAETFPETFLGKHGKTILINWKWFRNIEKDKTVYQISGHDGSESYDFVLHTETPENVELRAKIDEVEGLTAILPDRFRSQSKWADMFFEKVYTARRDIDKRYILKHGCTEDVYDQYLVPKGEQWKDEHQEGERGRNLWRQRDQNLVPKGEQRENKHEQEESGQSRLTEWLLKNQIDPEIVRERR